MKKLLTTIVLLVAFNAVAGTQFVCEFGSSVAFVSANLDSPQSKIEKGKSKYTFMLNNAGTAGTYINLEFGQALPINVIFNGSTAIIVEKNTTNNHFVATVFMDKNSAGQHPAVFTQHSFNPKGALQALPSTALGSCVSSQVKNG